MRNALIDSSLNSALIRGWGEEDTQHTSCAKASTDNKIKYKDKNSLHLH